MELSKYINVGWKNNCLFNNHEEEDQGITKDDKLSMYQHQDCVKQPRFTQGYINTTLNPRKQIILASSGS